MPTIFRIISAGRGSHETPHSQYFPPTSCRENPSFQTNRNSSHPPPEWQGSLRSLLPKPFPREKLRNKPHSSPARQGQFCIPHPVRSPLATFSNLVQNKISTPGGKPLNSPRNPAVTTAGGTRQPGFRCQNGGSKECRGSCDVSVALPWEIGSEKSRRAFESLPRCRPVCGIASGKSSNSTMRSCRGQVWTCYHGFACLHRTWPQSAYTMEFLSGMKHDD